jgi:hypothetical protein
MIGTIRRHSKWLWGIIITATVISFIYWGAGPSRLGGNGRRISSDFGSIYGHKITLEAYRDARHEVDLYFLFNYHIWPEKEPNLTAAELDREIYARLMLVQKGEDLGVYVSDKAIEDAALQLLRSPSLLRWLGINGPEVPVTALKQLLQPEGLIMDDFKRFVQHDLVIGQLQQIIGLAGALVTPQEAAAAYQRSHQELSVQIVFFSAANYLSSVAVTPAAVEQFYTNDLAAYRLPDRVQVSYVAFAVTNFLAEAEQELAKTNLNEQVETIYRQYGVKAFPEERTPEGEKARIREALIHHRALADARLQANEFATEVFSREPVRAENLTAVAGQKGLAVHVTAPFASKSGPEEFVAPVAFVKAAFELTPDAPFAQPVTGPDAVYVMALAKQLPSENPPLDQIRDRVTEDYRIHEAVLLAQRAGTNFVRTLAGQMAGGRSFASVCAAAGLPLQVLPPFSLSATNLPELGDAVDLNQLKQAAFSTPVGKTSDFAETSDGGFIVYVQALLPFDRTQMNAALPQFAALLRRARQNEAFDQWLQIEASRELRDIPALRQQARPGGRRLR